MRLGGRDGFVLDFMVVVEDFFKKLLAIMLGRYWFIRLFFRVVRLEYALLYESVLPQPVTLA